MPSHGFKLKEEYAIFFWEEFIYLISIDRQELTFKYETEPSKNKDTNTIHCCCRLTDNMILFGDHNSNLIQCKVEDGEITDMEKIKGKFFNNDICLLGDGSIAVNKDNRFIKIW